MRTRLDERMPPLTAELWSDVAWRSRRRGGDARKKPAAQSGGGGRGMRLRRTQPEVQHKPGPYISFEHVYKSFGDFQVLQDVSFCVNPGETLCILGRSGVGKSVSLQMLMGFLKPDSGTVLVAGQDIAGFSEREMQEVRRKVTMVFQNGALFDSITRGRERGVSAARARRHGGRPDYCRS